MQGYAQNLFNSISFLLKAKVVLFKMFLFSLPNFNDWSALYIYYGSDTIMFALVLLIFPMVTLYRAYNGSKLF